MSKKAIREVDLSACTLLPGLNRALVRMVDLKLHNKSPILRTDQPPDLVAGELVVVGPTSEENVPLLWKAGAIAVFQPASMRKIADIAGDDLAIVQMHDVLFVTADAPSA